MRDQEIADIILVESGFKPAAMVELAHPIRASAASWERYQKKVRSFEKTLRDSGLFYALRINRIKTSSDVTKYSYIAKDRRTLKKLAMASAEKNTGKRRLVLGKILGYPISAVRAFARNKSIQNNDIPARVRRSVFWKFLNFRLSQSWREEMEYVYKRARAIRHESPEFYKKIRRRKMRVA